MANDRFPGPPEVRAKACAWRERQVVKPEEYEQASERFGELGERVADQVKGIMERRILPNIRE